MPKRKNKAAEQLIEALTGYLRALPPDAYVEMDWKAGIERRAGDDGMMDFNHNGSQTITIRINGGANDTTALPKYLDKPEFAELKAFHLRRGRSG